MLLCAAGLAICYRANVWNIGAEGQLLIGSWVALNVMGLEGLWVLPAVLVAGSLAGLLRALIPAMLRNHFNTNEILTTIMLNYIALNLLL